MPNDKEQDLSGYLPKQTTPAPKEEDFNLQVNANPRANENVNNGNLADKGDAADVGSEITDGEAS
jgi:hypothetical protein